MTEGTQRRLAAIVAIDVAGYSRLMGADEDATLAALKIHREATVPIGQAHGGRVVGTAGDGELWEFPSVTEAVTCAIEVQALMAARNAEIPGDQKMLYRIGINLGDVMIDGDDIYGDGINVAARIEALAEPGGICLSHTVHDQIRDRLDIAFEDMGEIEVKNIARPVRTYRVALGQAKATARPARSRRAPRLALVSAAAVVVLLAVVAGVLAWLQPWQPAFNPALALPEKPSIAVLPFANLSDDPKQEYFADGMTEDLITDLSKRPDLFVIARNSSFAFRDQKLELSEIDRKLGVQYVVDGSVRRHGDRLRVNAKLVNVKTNGSIWADRFDGKLDRIFDFQDTIISRIVAAITGELSDTASKSADQSKQRVSTAAYEKFLLARASLRLVFRL